MKPELWFLADSDLRSAKWGLNTGDEYDLRLAAYHVQQCVEKTLKSYLKEWGIPHVKTHDLMTLLARIPVGHEGISDDTFDSVVDKATTLSDWEGNTRYTEGYSVIRSQVVRYWELAEQLHLEVGMYLDSLAAEKSDKEKKSLREMDLEGRC